MIGHDETTRRRTRNAIWLATLISGAYLIYNVQGFRSASGRVVTLPYGYIIEIALALLLSIAGLFALNNGKKSGAFWLMLGGASLWYLSLLAFMITLPVPITWMIARLIFKHHPTHAVWGVIIPPVVCFAVWIGEQYFFMETGQKFLSSVLKKFSQPQSLPTDLVQAIVIAPEGARLRAGPTTRAATLGTLESGAIITILGREGEWYKIRHRSAGQTRIGYLHTSLAKVEGTVDMGDSLFSLGQESTTLPPPVSPSSPSESSTALAGHQARHDSLDPTEGDEGDSNFHLESRIAESQFQHSLLGRWEGTLGNQLLLLVIESFTDDHGLGYSEVRWTKNAEPIKLELECRFDRTTLEVEFVQKQKGSRVGTFTGTVSPNGNAMSGIWTFAEDPSSQSSEWSAHRSINVSIKN